MTVREKIIGVLGGMGPEAALDFLRRLLAGVDVKGDSDHIHVILDNNSKVPSRIAHLIDGDGEDPTPSLMAMARGLERQGADFLTIPCNTAHFYIASIRSSVSIPVLDMIGLAVAEIQTVSPESRRIGILGSPALKKIDLYRAQLEISGLEPLYPSNHDQDRLFSLILSVKAGGVSQSIINEYRALSEGLIRAGAEALIIACTEFSLIPRHDGPVPSVDALDALVRASILAAKGA